MVVEPEITVAEGQNASFRCSSTEQATLEWNFNQDVPLPDNVRVEVFQQYSELTVTNALRSNQGRYFCVGQGNLPLLIDRDFARLYVYSTFIIMMNILQLKHFRFSIAPLLKLALDPPTTSVIVDVGSNVSLVCSLDCFCPGANLTWKRGYNGSLPDSAVVSRSD